MNGPMPVTMIHTYTEQHTTTERITNPKRKKQQTYKHTSRKPEHKTTQVYIYLYIHQTLEHTHKQNKRHTNHTHIHTVHTTQQTQHTQIEDTTQTKQTETKTHQPQ